MQAPTSTEGVVCNVCDQGAYNDTITICANCADPEKIVTHCNNCTNKLRLGLEEARRIFEKAGIKISTTGLVVVYKDSCPACSDGDCMPVIYEID